MTHVGIRHFWGKLLNFETNVDILNLTIFFKKTNCLWLPTLYPGSLPTPGAAEKTLIGVRHVNPQILGGKSNKRLFATKGGVVEGRMRFSCLRITKFVKISVHC